MFRRKLLSLDFHTPNTFNPNDVKEFRSMVAWLEDQKIRHYKIEDRDKLRNIAAADWTDTFQAYLTDLGSPYDTNNQVAALDWLLGLAVRAEYGDNVEKYKSRTAESIAKPQSAVPQIVSSNPLDNLDFDDPAFKTGVNSLAQLLNITKHPDHLVTLRAICRLVKNRLSVEAVQKPNEIIVEGTAFPLNEVELGFDAGDYVLNQASKILRLLFIRDLRNLQTRINEAIVAVQSITANPKTDTRLGKVGK